MVTSELIEQKGKSTEQYLDSISDEYKKRWNDKLHSVEFTDEQFEFLNKQLLPINIVVISEEWCPDCQNGVSIVMKMAEVSDLINLTILERDANEDELQGYKTNGGFRIPFVLFANDKYEEITRWVERSTLSYKLVFEAKLTAIEKDIDDYKKHMVDNFREHSDARFQENINELFDLLKKSVYMYNASASLKKLNSIIPRIS